MSTRATARVRKYGPWRRQLEGSGGRDARSCTRCAVGSKPGGRAMGCTSVVARPPTIRAGMCANHLSDLTGSDCGLRLSAGALDRRARRLEWRNGDRRGPGAPESRRDRAQQGDESRPAGSCKGDANREIGPIRLGAGGPNPGEGARRLLDVGELSRLRHATATFGLRERVGRFAA